VSPVRSAAASSGPDESARRFGLSTPFDGIALPVRPKNVEATAITAFREVGSGLCFEVRRRCPSGALEAGPVSRTTAARNLAGSADRAEGGSPAVLEAAVRSGGAAAASATTPGTRRTPNRARCRRCSTASPRSKAAAVAARDESPDTPIGARSIVTERRALRTRSASCARGGLEAVVSDSTWIAASVRGDAAGEGGPGCTFSDVCRCAQARLRREKVALGPEAGDDSLRAAGRPARPSPGPLAPAAPLATAGARRGPSAPARGWCHRSAR
jgi:hypothetical protein